LTIIVGIKNIVKIMQEILEGAIEKHSNIFE
jgi:hypothetical protein